MRITLWQETRAALLFVLFLTLAIFYHNTRPPVVRLPKWVDGIAYVSSRMADKDLYYINQADVGSLTSAQSLRVLRSNARAWQSMIAFMKAQRELEAAGVLPE